VFLKRIAMKLSPVVFEPTSPKARSVVLFVPKL